MRKSNEAIKNVILERLAEVEYTHTYAFAIRDEKMVKAVIVENADEILPLITYCEKNAESHGATWGVRMNNRNDIFAIIKEYAREIIPMYSTREFERMFLEAKENGYKRNRGNFFEDKFAELTGGEQNPNTSAKCTECGDVILNGEHIQCKFWNATVTTETQVNKFYTNYLQKKIA